MKLFFTSLAICLLASPVYSQVDTTRNHVFKINLSSLIARNISVQYEQKLGRRSSLALGLRFQPEGPVPFQDRVKERLDDPDIKVGEARMSNLAITPEMRFYFHRSNLTGLYLAPYARFAQYSGKLPITYTGLGTVRTADFEGSFWSLGAGALLGYQWALGRRWVLDLWILGAHAGFADGQLDFRATLFPPEQENLRATLDALDIPFYKIEHDIRNDGGTIRAKGAWGGIRMGVNLGIRW